ncbi:MAG: SH3 domain-containing protein [Candidatus Latescibacterota bacterium]|nr:SH3 domain-containing protein [Candidatus Latescibacterota bacterium]
MPFMMRVLMIALFHSLAAPLKADPMFIVDREQVNIREDATTQSRRISVLKRGEEVELLGRHQNWLQIRLPDGQIGWVHSQLMQERLLIVEQGVRIRSGPSTNDSPVTIVYRGQEVHRLRSRGGWTEVKLQDGRTGWVNDRFVRSKTSADAGSEVPAVKPVADSEESPEPQAETDAKSDSIDIDEPVQRNPYAEGLQHEAGGDYERALKSFEEVLIAEPANVNALFHAAQAHRHLGQLRQALTKLYRAQDLSGGRKDIYLTMWEVYRLSEQPDSAAKYQALFRGRPIPSASAGADGGDSIVDEGSAEEEADEGLGGPWLLLGLAGIGLFALGGLAWWISVSSGDDTDSKAQVSASTAPASKFSRMLGTESSAAAGGEATAEEEMALERQIEDRWRELRTSDQLFKAAVSAGGGGEAAEMKSLLDQIDELRSNMDAQGERAKVYADIVRLQNMKIEAMTEEIRRLRARK